MQQEGGWYTFLVAATTQGKFEEFIGIDWSGAKGPYQKKVKVARCVPGESVPKLVLPPQGENWRRDELLDWVIEKANQRRLLVGADFAFAYPYCDQKAYFPGHPESPESAPGLWQAVETICHDESNFYGGPFYKDQAASFSQYLCYPTYTGPHFDNNRRRRTERACQLMRARPACSFKCVGPDQVGAGSVAGMRALHYLATNHGNILSIWPFDSAAESKSTLVEIFPRLFFILARADPQRWNSISVINTVLEHFGSKPLSLDTMIRAEDEADAIVSAAALRGLSSRRETWHPQNLNANTRIYEGWIFGST
ncbi:hypothetical protein M1N93_02935 [Dehalococcoidia bacterium]|nr:hypothetical protein [Dehalococcoidia bacterium]